MAFTSRLNLTASSGTTVGPINILTAGDNAGAISSILVSNRTSDKELTVDLYLYNNTTAVTVYIVKSAIIPVGSSLKVNGEGVLQLGAFSFTPTAVKGGLYYDDGDDEFYAGKNN